MSWASGRLLILMIPRASSSKKVWCKFSKPS
jgi:hypothetical protein